MTDPNINNEEDPKENLVNEVEFPPTTQYPDEDEVPHSAKKREREVSMEPSSIQDAQQLRLSPSSSRDLHLPSKPKRNRLEDINATVDESSPPHTPPNEPHSPTMLQSPAHESKVTQIRQRVEDMSWQDETESDNKFVQSESHELPSQSKGESGSTATDSSPILSPTQVHAPSDSANAKPDRGNESGSDNSETTPEESSEVPSKRKMTNTSPAVISAELSDVSRKDTSKRPRDEADQEQDIRDPKKRVTPPPEMSTTSATGATSGFLAYTQASPFGAAKPDLNGLAEAKPASTSGHPPNRKPNTPIETLHVESTPSPSVEIKPKPVFGMTSAPRANFTGFGGFGSPPQTSQPSTFGASSPLGAVGPRRSKSPLKRGNAFTPYNSASRGFTSTPRRKRSASPVGSTGSAEGTMAEEGIFSKDIDDGQGRSFAERLQDEQDIPSDTETQHKVDWEELEVVTGEEDEKTIYSVRGKLYVLSEQKLWKERGVGPLKMNVRRSDGSGARLVMRKEGVHSVLLNAILFPGMQFDIAQDPRFVRFGAYSDSRKTFDQYNLRLSSSKTVEEFVDTVQSYVPET